MLHSLRSRLILSHMLPLLVIIPLAGVAILYTLETLVLLPNLSKQLVGEARLVAKIAGGQPQIWQDPSIARELVLQTQPDLTARVMILSTTGRILASSDPSDADRLGQQLDIPEFSSTQPGEVVSQVDYSQRLRGEIVDVYAPVLNKDNQAIGIVRMSYRYLTVYEEFMQLRYLIASILVVSLLAGLLLGLVLAMNISKPLERAIQAVYDLARGTREDDLVERGPLEIRQLQRSVNHLMERLHSLELARRQLLANLVHEIGRPLGAVHAALQALLLTRKGDPELEEMLTGMQEETGRLKSLLDELAQLHDQVLGTLELERRPVNLSEWLPGILRPWEAAAREKSIHWEAALASDLPTIEIDPLRLAQVVGNLTSNAIKYTPADGTVSVTAGVAAGMVWIRVSDTGPGISPDEAEKIFTPFYRGAQGSRITQGMGLGLNIAQTLVNAHEGRLEVESQPGEGSRFTIWLPYTAPVTPE